MTSLIKADNIAKADGTSEVATEYVTQGSAKAWANLNGTGTIALRDSMNISGAVDNGTGDYTYSYSANFSNANYSAFVSGDNDGVTEARTAGSKSNQQYNASGVRMFFTNTSGTAQDCNVANISTHGSLA